MSGASTVGPRPHAGWARQRRRALLIHAAGLLLVLLAVALVATVQEGPNPDRPAAEALVVRLETAATVAATGTPVGAAAARVGLVGAPVTLPNGAVIDVVVGEAAGECYALAWGPSARWARVLTPGLPCEPSPVVASISEADVLRQTPTVAQHLMLAPTAFDWEQVLPPSTALRPWFLPVALALAAVALAVFVRLTLVLLPGWSPEA